MLEEAQPTLFPLWPRLDAVPAGEVIAGRLEGADEGRHTRAGAERDGERAALETSDEAGRTATRSSVQSVVGLGLAVKWGTGGEIRCTVGRENSGMGEGSRNDFGRIGVWSTARG